MYTLAQKMPVLTVLKKIPSCIMGMYRKRRIRHKCHSISVCTEHDKDRLLINIMNVAATHFVLIDGTFEVHNVNI